MLISRHISRLISMLMSGLISRHISRKANIFLSAQISKINANVVRVRSLPGVKSRHQNIDTVIIRFVK